MSTINRGSKRLSGRKAFFLERIERAEVRMRYLYMFKKQKEHQRDWPDWGSEVDRMWSSVGARLRPHEVFCCL